MKLITDLFTSFGLGGLMTIVFVCLAALYLLPIWFLVQFAKREKKDWRIALVTGLLFTWLFALLVLLIVPKLSDEDALRINGPEKPARRSFSMGREPVARGPRDPWELPTMDDVFKPMMWFLGICSGFALGVMVWMQWLM